MTILIVCPARARSLHGNRITALRWARMLRSLGARVGIAPRYTGQRCDMLVALHARKSSDSVLRFRATHPDRPLVVALTGTDLYRDLRRDRHARDALEHATRIVVLQPLGLAELPSHLRARARVVYQSAVVARRRALRSRRTFDVCVIGHLRAEKDPFRTPLAARRLPPGSRIRVLQLGEARQLGMARRARREEACNPRYRWLGGRPRRAALGLLARSRLMVISSRIEGGANVVSEALATGTPILASRIPGNVGLLGPRHPGYFPCGDTHALAALLVRFESDARFQVRLRDASIRRRTITDPRRERRAWRRLLDVLGVVATAGGLRTL